jgi:sugar (pentulose or hexulose) kinase
MRDPDLAGARGAALLAHHRAGVLTDDDLDRLVPIDATYEPVAARRALYDAMHEQFVAAFDALRPVYHALNE